MSNSRHQVGELAWRPPVLLLSTAVLAYATFAMESAVGQQRQVNLLTWQETVGVVYDTYWSNAYMKRANPEAKDAIWKILDNESYLRYHPRAVRMLAFIGDEADVKRLRDWVKVALRNYVKIPKAQGVFEIGTAVGLMARRDVPGARAYIEEMNRETYWREVAKSADIAPGQLTDETVDRLIYHAFTGLARSGEPNLEKYAEAITKDIADPVRKTSLLFYCKPDSNRQSAAAFLASLDEPVSTNGLAEKVVGTPDNFRPSTIHDFVEDSKYLKNRTGGRRKDGYVTGVNVTDKLPADERDALAKEAVEAFRQISREMLDEKLTFRDWAGKLLSGGRAIDVGFREKLPVFFEDLKRIAQVTREVVELDPKPAEFEFWQDQVDCQKIFYFRQVTGKEIEVITVMFRLEGTESIEYTVRQDNPTRREDGYLVVLMKKVDGKWYWNPFGW